jgi:hypothetical protein
MNRKARATKAVMRAVRCLAIQKSIIIALMCLSPHPPTPAKRDVHALAFAFARLKSARGTGDVATHYLVVSRKRFALLFFLVEG